MEGIMMQKWNSEQSIVFAAVILQHKKGVRLFKDVWCCMMHRMDLWEKKKLCVLVEDTTNHSEARNH
eukprot:14376896-Ditylum_brightwellii.AAC.2